nr:MAG: ORF1 [TTV-like mini virus]
MPWRYYRWRRRRPWRNYWRRPRTTFRARYYRRRRYRVRRQFKKKLSKIRLTQYQPPTVKKCNIKGLLNLIYYNVQRIPHNSAMYENSIVPPFHPGGGGFSVLKLSLEAAYDLHLRCHNWWTSSNDNLPLVRYNGTTIKLYYSNTIDYVFKYANYLPSTSGPLTYPSCQPSMMMMAKNSIIMPSKRTKPRKKPYKKLFIKPTSQLENKWYFQTAINKTPLVTFYTAACGIDNYFLGPTWESQNITIYHLNTGLFQNPNFKNYPHETGYSPKSDGTIQYYLYLTLQEQQPNNTYKYADIIPLTNTKDYTIGQSQSQNKGSVSNYKNNWYRYAGNPFLDIFEDNYIRLISQQNPPKFFEKFEKETDTFNLQQKNMTLLTESLYLQTRYNPNRDQGINNRIYLVNVEKPGKWDTPTDPKSLLEGYPMWLSIYGFADFKKKQGIIGVDTGNAVVFTMDNTLPKFNKPFVMIDDNFRGGTSPYQKDVHPDDKTKWFPQTQYQQKSMNALAQCGPGTPKTETKADDIKMEYIMHFKFGGAPAKMLKIENPAHQDFYPVPNNDQQTTSLQNPAYPPEYYIYSFDQRQDQITSKAAKRLKKDWGSKTDTFQFTESPLEVPALPTSQESPEETDSEKEEETLYLKLLQQRNKQRELRHRIKQLIQKSQNLE